MKKLLLSLALILSLTINMNAQAPRGQRYARRAPSREYQHRPYRQQHVAPMPSTIGDFRLHVLADMGTDDFSRLFWHEVPEHFSLGAMAEYQAGHITSIGLGAEFYSTLYTVSGYGTEYLNAIPIYGNLRFSTPGGPIRPFIEGRVGYAQTLNKFVCGDMEYSTGGMYTGAAAGLSIYNLNLSFGVSAIDVYKTLPEHYMKDVVVDYTFRISFAFGGSY